MVVKEGDVLFGENFHAVVPGELYRSAQLSGSRLERHIQAEGIRTVINLRGPNPGSAW
jgi:protein tyrosine/serine phosphatase